MSYIHTEALGTGATATEWVARWSTARSQRALHEEFRRLVWTPLPTDEVGYLPFEIEAANLFFPLVSSRYERASVIVTSNKLFGRWGEVFGLGWGVHIL